MVAGHAIIFMGFDDWLMCCYDYRFSGLVREQLHFVGFFENRFLYFNFIMD